jgi:hypothetical protein
MIKVITNSMGSGDWLIVEQNGSELFSGHRVTTMELLSILEQLGHETDFVELTDEQLEEGAY